MWVQANLVSHLIWDQEIGGSNPSTRTNYYPKGLYMLYAITKETEILALIEADDPTEAFELFAQENIEDIEVDVVEYDPVV